MSIYMKFFVLKPGGTNCHAKASRLAMRLYASEIHEHDPEMATELRAWAERSLADAEREIERKMG